MKRKIFVLAAIISSSQLPAQDSASVKSLDEVIISANKYPNKTSLTGKVVTVISRQQIEQAGGKDISQLLTEQVGLYASGANSNPGKDKSIYLRGARTDHTLITIDGVPVYDASGIGSNFDIRLIALDNIERIEILKGSQSTLYGSDAIAGVINIITKKTSGKKVSGYGAVHYGSFNTSRVQAGINGKSGIFDYNIGISHFNTDGINEVVDSSHSAHPTDKDGYRQNSLQANFGIQASKQITLRPYFRYTHYNSDLDQGAFTDELDYTSTLKNWQSGIRGEIAWGKSQLNVLYNYNDNYREYIDDSVKSQNGFAKYSKGQYTGREHYLEAFIVSPILETIRLTAGLDYRTSNSDQEYHSISIYGPFSSKLAKDSMKNNQIGAYAALNIKASKTFFIEAGGRLNNHSVYGTNFVYNINPCWLIRQQLKLFANLSSGYKTPSLYQLFSEFGNKKLKPEKAVSWEGGIQFFTAAANAMARITYFKRDVKDVIAFFFNPSTFQAQYINQDKQKDDGIEFESAIPLTKTTLLKLFYTHVDGKITTQNNGKDTVYFNLIRRPKNVAGINIGSQFTKRFSFSSNLQFIGKRTDIRVDPNTFQQSNITLKSYVLWDVYAEYGFLSNRLKLFADIRNIANAKYNEIYGYNAPGFNACGGIRFQF